MKKMLLILTSIALGAGMLMAQTADPPSVGDGSESTPYQIATLNNLYWMTQNSGEWDKYFEQTADIDASSTSGWDSNAGFTPIGNSSVNFTGSYDGQDYTISDLTISRPGTDNIGIFGYISGSTIENLGMINVNIHGANYVGGLVGYNNSSSTVMKCYSTGSVTGGNNVGGLVGANMSSSIVFICYCTGSVNGANNVGGLVGYDGTTATVSDCYSTGSVTGGNSYIGGLVGSQNSATVRRCYSAGSVTGSSYVGGLLGYNNSTVSNSFWDTDSSGQSGSAGGTGKTTVQMKIHTTFTTAGWDFEAETANGTNDYWDMDYSGTKNNGYPYLSWEDGDDISLPVDLASFSASQEGRTVVLEWITESEVENLGFILERKTDNTVWLKIASYQTHTALEGQGNKSNRTEYIFKDSDVEPGNSYYYRLSDVSTSGDVTTYPPIFIQLDALPEETLMEKAYPNPFNPYTYISYHLYEDTDVVITVIDMLGRSVKTLFNGNQVAGSYHVYWNGADENGIKTSTGNYIIRMHTESITQIQKVMFIK